MRVALFAKRKSIYGSEFAGSTASVQNDRGTPTRGVASDGDSHSTPIQVWTLSWLPRCFLCVDV